eukprot:7283285-Alexandrium_andersonii.AAC.1
MAMIGLVLAPWVDLVSSMHPACKVRMLADDLGVVTSDREASEAELVDAHVAVVQTTLEYLQDLGAR